MRQGIVLFCGPKTENSALQPAVIKALGQIGSVFLAYPDAKSGAELKLALKMSTARFFPQAARDTLGERLAQAFAFLFIQGYEQVALMLGGHFHLSEEAVLALFAGFSRARLAGPAGAAWLVVDRAHFPEVAFIFDTVNWDQPEARAKAETLLSHLSEGGIEA